MLFNTLLSGLTVASVAMASAIHRVDVGNGGLKFTPNRTVAAVGDVIEFYYFPKNHSVVQSLFTNPCESTQGFFSGFVPVSSGSGDRTFRLLVNDTKPIWFYCSQGTHCASGMVGCVNCPTTGNTIDAYAALAKKVTSPATEPAEVEGGTFFAAGKGWGTGTTSATVTVTVSQSSSATGSDTTTTSTSGGSSSATTTSATSASVAGTTSSSPTPSPTNAAAAVDVSKFALLGLGAAAVLL